MFLLFCRVEQMQKHTPIKKYYFLIAAAILIIILLPLIIFLYSKKESKQKKEIHFINTAEWTAPDTATIPQTKEGDLIKYGRSLIINTAYYLGPKGTIAHISNGMNCDNCHMNAGTKLWANNFSAVKAKYPLYRNRSSSIETIQMRINACFERSLNGKKLSENSKEMAAIMAYINWVGQGVTKASKIVGTGSEILPFIDEPADSARGRILFISKCQLCHGANGEGKSGDYNGYVYPPLWGNHSYNNGAGMYELSKLAGYIKNNMPYGADSKKPVLTDRESWDIAAYINSNPRPVYKDLKNDWHNISTKPVDYPFGPYSDTFSQKQHKYGPFNPIALAHKNKK